MASNTVTLSTVTNNITITWYSRHPSNINVQSLVPQSSTDIVQVTTRGPQGPRGPQGIPGQLELYENAVITGSLRVSGGLAEGNISASSITVSGDVVGSTGTFDSLGQIVSTGIISSGIVSASGFSGSLEGTASFASTSSFSLSTLSSSYAQTSSKLILEEQELDHTGLVLTLRPNSVGANEAGFKSAAGRNLTIFTADNPVKTLVSQSTELRIGNTGKSGGLNFLNASGDPAYIKTNVSDLYLISNQGLYFSGSNITVLNPLTASAISASGEIVGTASFATTASFALNVPEDSGFPFTGSAEISGSLNVIGPITGSSYASTGTGIPTLVSDSNINLTAKNGAVIITTSSLRLTSYENSETGSIVFVAGDIYFNTDVNKFMGYNGTDHIILG